MADHEVDGCISLLFHTYGCIAASGRPRFKMIYAWWMRIWRIEKQAWYRLLFAEEQIENMLCPGNLWNDGTYDQT